MRIAVLGYLLECRGEMSGVPDRSEDALPYRLPPRRNDGDHGSARTGSLLVIEDEPLLAKNVKRYLERHGYKVSVASDVDDGLRQFAILRPRLVLIDFHLPGGTGLQVLRAIRGIDARVAMIIMSGQSSPAVAGAVTESGADAYLTKPIILQHLKQIIDAALRVGSAGQPQA